MIAVESSFIQSTNFLQSISSLFKAGIAHACGTHSQHSVSAATDQTRGSFAEHSGTILWPLPIRLQRIQLRCSTLVFSSDRREGLEGTCWGLQLPDSKSWCRAELPWGMPRDLGSHGLAAPQSNSSGEQMSWKPWRPPGDHESWWREPRSWDRGSQ